MLHRLVVSVLLLWLPLQGLAAVTMSFCRHTLDTGVALASQERHEGADHAHHAHEHQHSVPAHPSDPGDQHGGLTCNDCSSCHLACAAAVLSTPTRSEVVPVTGGVNAEPLLVPPAVVLDQPNPPPLSRG